MAARLTDNEGCHGVQLFLFLKSINNIRKKWDSNDQKKISWNAVLTL